MASQEAETTIPRNQPTAFVQEKQLRQEKNLVKGLAAYRERTWTSFVSP
jgi:hypothetical protein